MLPTSPLPGAAGLHLLLPRHGDDAHAMDADADECHGAPLQLGRQGLRIVSIFIILVASLLGALVPVVLSRQSRMHVPKSTFFVCKFVGTGVIVATAWMHLLTPAVEQLGNGCVGRRWPSVGSYPWAMCIPLMTIMVMFLVELLAARPADDGPDDDGPAAGSDSDTDPSSELAAKKRARSPRDDVESQSSALAPAAARDVGGHGGANGGILAGQLTAIFVLEFGVVFHSIFIGLTLGTTAEDELVVLFIVLVFHQMLEGLGLGSRLALAPWGPGRGWVPYALAFGFALSTPVGIAAGMGAKPSDATTQKLVNGIFDSVSAGILLYTGLVELLGHEFMFNRRMRTAPLRVQLAAFACVAVGVTIMALLAKWA